MTDVFKSVSQSTANAVAFNGQEEQPVAQAPPARTEMPTIPNACSLVGQICGLKLLS
jgi:hypothetical protein